MSRKPSSFLLVAVTVLPAILLASALRVTTPPANAQVHDDHNSTPLMPYVHYLHAFAQRRRANVFFKNEQSIFRGVQVNFVNVGTGNLTFARRDIVVPGQLPLIVARVYDSAATGSGDFGPGWRLSAAERIEISDAGACLFAETGDQIEFVAAGDRFVLAKDFPSDYKDLIRLPSGDLLLTQRTGITKLFSAAGSAYRLAKVADANGNELRLTYSGVALKRLENGTHSLEFFRGPLGRIVVAQDDLGRKVSYGYSANGLVTSATDLGGNVWTYEYTAQNTLSRAADSLGRDNFRISYTPDGRVRTLDLPSGSFTYEYSQAARTTTVTNRKGQASRYAQNEEGITISVSNPLGETTRIVLDQGRNVTQLLENGGVQQEMRYDPQHHLTLRRNLASSVQTTTTYSYDPTSGQLTSVQSSDGSVRSFSYDGRGNVTSISDSKGLRSFTYTSAGELASIRGPGTASVDLSYGSEGLVAHVNESSVGKTDLAYDPRGRLTSVALANGLSIKTQYDALGLRRQLDYSTGRKVQYWYDVAGNMNETYIEPVNGPDYGETLEIDSSYQVRKQILPDGTQFLFDYDDSGNLIKVTKGTAVTQFVYDALDRLTGVITADGQKLQYVYAPGEPSLVIQADIQTLEVPSARVDSGWTFSPEAEIFTLRTVACPLGSVRFSPNLLRYQLSGADGKEIAAAGHDPAAFLKALQLQQAATPSAQRFANFTSPTNNAFFLPPEFATINCCILCPVPPDPSCGGCDPPPPLPSPPTPGFLQVVSSTVTTACQGASCEADLKYKVLDLNQAPMNIAGMTIRESASSDNGTCHSTIIDSGQWSTDSTGTMIGVDAISTCPGSSTCQVSFTQSFTVDGFGVLILNQGRTISGSHNAITISCTSTGCSCPSVVITP